MSFANSVILYNCKINHNGLFGCDFGGSGATRDSVMGASNALATVKFTYGSCTYMRKDKTITVDENADVLDAAGVNYCRYINTDFSSNHYFYAFIEKIEYVAPQTSRLYIKTDVFMTYFHKIIPNQCFVEREHVADDTPFIHTLPEPVTVGEAKTCDVLRATTFSCAAINISTFKNNYLCCVAKSSPITGLNWPTDNFVGGVPNLIYYYGCEVEDLSNLLHLIETDPVQGGLDDIIAIYPILRDTGTLVITPRGESSSGQYFYTIADGDNVHDVRHFPVSRSFVASGATTNNRKCLTFPYNYITLTNNNGSTTDLKLEYFSNIRTGEGDEFVIDTYYSPTIDSQLLSVPRYYNRPLSAGSSAEADNWEYGIEYTSFPQVEYPTNIYENYISRHMNTMMANKINFGTDLIKSGMDLGNGNPMPLVGTMQSIINYEAGLEDMKLQGNKMSGMPTGNIQMKAASAGTFVEYKCIQGDDLKHVDSFFDRYGYNISECKTPQWNSRPLFNYVKTNGANIGGEIPQSDKEEINKLLDTGMTVWHTVGSYGIYDGANNLAPTR